MNRRVFLQGAVGTGIAAGVFTGTATADPSGSLTLEDQTTPDGQTVVVADIEVDQDAMLGLRNQRTDESIYFSPIESGSYEDYEVSVGPPITEESRISTSLYPEGGGSSFARETATVDVPPELEVIDGVEQTLIEADPAAGFEYPFYLYAPQRAGTGDIDSVPVLVEPANSGQATDDMDVHLEAGERLVDGSLTRVIAGDLGTPLVVPVFPRPKETPVDGTHYTHALDDTTMGIDDGPLERIDLQVLNMVDRARDRLEDDGYPVQDDGIVMNGFSASGNFVDRFTVLHPDEVISVTAGGLNGMPLLPVDEFAGQELPYHVGTADVEALTNSPVDREALDETNQFLYMGAEDDNDTIGFDDAWTDESLEQLALDVYGDDMITERFPTSQQIYEEAGISAQFRIYPNAGHTPSPAVDDITEFHKRSIDGEDLSTFGDDLGTDLQIDVSPDTPSSESEVMFDASDSTAAAGSAIVAYQWDFGDGADGTGETATHTYTEEGEFTVVLTVITDEGNEHEDTIEVTVEGADEPATDDDAEDETADEPTTDADDRQSAETVEDQPGFGIGSALAGLGGLAYMLTRRLSDTEQR